MLLVYSREGAGKALENSRQEWPELYKDDFLVSENSIYLRHNINRTVEIEINV